MTQHVQAGVVTLLLSLSITSLLAGQTPSVDQALRLRPMQQDVNFDTPPDAKTCTITSETSANETSWVVKNAAGELLRRFVDSNADNKVDQWRYYQAGIEVYRDIDADFNGKADQYRWLGTDGTRWGIDKDEDGEIDQWKAISAEEVTEQVVYSLKHRDKQRFSSILLSESELNKLGLGSKLKKVLGERIQAATKNFAKLAGPKGRVGKDTEWIDFGGLRPGTIPVGTNGSTQDVTVYENVVAMVETKGKSLQIPIGTIIKVGDGWRIVDLPAEGASPEFVFFEAASHAHSAEGAGVSAKTQELIAKLEDIDKSLSTTQNAAKVAKLNEQRADTLEALAEAATRQSDKELWWLQFADTVSTAAQSGQYPEGTRRLGKLRKTLESRSSNSELLSHVTFGHMSAEYAEKLQQEDVNFGEVQDAWLEQLEDFVGRFGKQSDAPEAMLQLALGKEFAGEEEEANEWYTKIVKDFGDSPLAKKAAGAKRRLECVGKPLKLKGNTVTGKPFDLARLRGNVVLVHYWATWCEPCKQDMEILKKLSRDLKREKFEIVGINVDAQPEQLAKFYRAEKPAGTHLYEEGGLDSRLASEMGVFTLPVMLLVDQRGRVVNRQLHGAQLKTEIQKLLKKK